ncbi:hypothetical protein Poly51_02800 [Rubripirellula tenax]|uniref:Uncharacterized protein n=1 Tax=Rubripirellula tenax TaxID=2528015 RepID=A0A5C6FIU3_9BACT|nr:hypothetical protein [Rubripirellula tenax]TWU60007.1 hypothetical protein Poly51_02800 [Rubripirellula tenax]
MSDSTDDPKSLLSDLSDDQIAISQYMSSRSYRRSLLQSGGRTMYARESIVGGVLSITMLVVAIGLTVALMIAWTQEWLGSLGTFLPMMMAIQTVLVPPMVAISFAVAMAMFWHRPVMLRVLVAIVMTVPGSATFILVLSAALGEPLNRDFWIPPFACLFAHFLAAGTVAVFVQLFTPWTLSHQSGPRAVSIAPTNLLSLFELTVFFAIGFAVLLAISTEEMILGLAFFAIWGSLSTAAIIYIMTVTLTPETESSDSLRHRRWIAIVFIFLCVVATNVFFAMSMYNWQLSLPNLPRIAASSLYGTALGSGTCEIMVSMLRSSRWTVVNRRSSPDDRSATR